MIAPILAIPLLGVNCGQDFLTQLLGPPVALITCPVQPSGDNFDIRAFYVPRYPGRSLTSVVMHLNTLFGPTGNFTLRMEARSDTYDGPLLATTTTTTFVGSGPTAVTFDFQDAFVRQGSTVTFDGEVISGPGTVLMGTTPCDNVVETNSSNPPLDTPRFGGRGVSVEIFGHP